MNPLAPATRQRIADSANEGKPNQPPFNRELLRKYCGTKASSIGSLTASSCPRHPSGANKGKHVLYEGPEKAKYECKYCGASASSISSLTGSSCPRHPLGSNKGKHEAAA
jgi:hypothetical protein